MSTRRILITGAAGNLGTKLRRHLELTADYELVLMDKRSTGEAAIVMADLSVYEDAWAARFSGVDTVVHLAADPSLWAPWSSLVRSNVDAAINVFEAALAHRVRRVVYASSVQVMVGYERAGVAQISVGLEPFPINSYGATKVFGERLGRSYAARHGLSVICLRLGWVLPVNHAHVLGDHPDARTKWLSDRDFCEYVAHAIVAGADVRFAIVNATSALEASKWDLTETVRVLGYSPQDKYVSPPTGIATAVARGLRRLINRARRVRSSRRAGVR